jgi:hypothetical protein
MMEEMEGDAVFYLVADYDIDILYDNMLVLNYRFTYTISDRRN